MSTSAAISLGYLTDTLSSYAGKDDLVWSGATGSTGIYYDQGSIGIGTNSPDYTIDIDGSASRGIRIKSTSTNTRLIFSSPNNYSPQINFKKNNGTGTEVQKWTIGVDQTSGADESFRIAEGVLGLGAEPLLTLWTGATATTITTPSTSDKIGIHIGSTNKSSDLTVYGNITSVTNDTGYTKYIYGVHSGATISDFRDMVADDQTPSVVGTNVLRTVANSGAIEITQLDEGRVGQIVTILCGSASNSPTISDGGNFKLSTAWEPGVSDTITLLYDGSSWFETSRSDN